MKTIGLVLLVMISFFSFSQDSLIYKGKIGKYSIELQLDKCNSENGIFEGKYRYEGKKSFLKLSGELTAPIIYMVETNKNDTTGYWYLEMIDDSIQGRWVGGNVSLPVVLSYVSGNKDFLKRKTEWDYNLQTDATLSGTYEVNLYFLNEMWVSEENLHPEVAYNGGDLIVQENENGTIDFTVEVVCGPTYHFAFADGVAEKKDYEYVYQTEEGCSISFVFNDKKVMVESNGSMECGFGARAYLHHEFVKVSNAASESENNKK